MPRFTAASILLLACLAAAQRSPYASRPVPSLLPRYRPDDGGLGNRVGIENSTPLPSNLQGTLEEDQLVQRVSEWPEEKQPFWFKNRHSISAQRERPVDGTFQQPSRPRPPFAGGQQTIDRQNFQVNEESNSRPTFQGAQQTFEREDSQITRGRPSFIGNQQSIDNTQISQQRHRETERLRPSYQKSIENANTQLDALEITGKPQREQSQISQQGPRGNDRQGSSYFQQSYDSSSSQRNQQDKYREEQRRNQRPWGAEDSRLIRKDEGRHTTNKRPSYQNHGENEWENLQQNHEISSLFGQNQERETHLAQHKRKPSYQDFIQKPQMR